MAVVSINQAAKLVGVARSTIYRKEKSGLLSFVVLPDGATAIDTAELYRVFPQQLQSDMPNATDVATATSRKIAELELELRLIRERLTAQLAESSKRETEAAERERWLQQQVENLTDTIKMLEHKPQPAPPSPRGFFARIFRRG